MKTENNIVLFLVDDDALYLKEMEIEFEQTGGFDISTFATGEKCMKGIAANPDIIILDYMLNGIDIHAMNGIETLDKIKAYNPEIAVIMLSSQDKIDIAVKCMHHKAYDYIVKSETAFLCLKKTISAILRYQKLENTLNWYIDKL